MRALRIAWWFGVVWATACGGTTKIGQQIVSDEGGGATSAGGAAASAGATGGVRAAGGLVSGTSGFGASGGSIVVSGGSGAGAFGGFTAENGGAGGQLDLCLGSDGQLRPGFKDCSRDSDCGTLQITKCCGSDLVVGLAYKVGGATNTCVVPGPDCAGVDCAKVSYVMAEDGHVGTAISARCEVSDSGQGTCRTFVTPAEDGGTTSCGLRPCGVNQLCALPPTNGPIQDFPFCVDIPPSCSVPLTCSCFAPDVCGGGAKFCFSIADHDMQCLFAP